MPEIGLVTVFWPFTTNGTKELAVQVDDTRSSVHCKVKPTALVGHVNTTSVPERAISNRGGLGGNEIPKTVPKPSPPSLAVPYKMLLDQIKAAYGSAPSPLIFDREPSKEEKL